MKNNFLIYLMGFFFIAFTACEKKTEKPEVIDPETAPSLFLSTDHVSLPPGGAWNIQLWSDADRLLEWKAKDVPGHWIIVQPDSGLLEKGEVKEIQIKLDSVYSNSSIIFTFEALNTKPAVIRVTGNSNYEGQNVLNLVPGVLHVDYQFDTASITIDKQVGNAINFKAYGLPEHFSLSPQEGIMEAYEYRQDLLMSFDREQLSGKQCEFYLKVENSMGSVDSILVQIPLTGLDQWALPFDIHDAEYDEVNNRIIAINNDLPEMLSVDPLNQTYETFELPHIGNCVSVGRDGETAVVGHDGFVSVIDLSKNEPVQTFPVGVDVLDIVLAPNTWAYLFNAPQQSHEPLRRLNVLTGEVILDTILPYKGPHWKAKLHPTENALYALHQNTSYPRVYKMKILSDSLNPVYSSEVNTASNHRDLCISRDGKWIIPKDGSLFRYSDDPENDLIHHGFLETNKRIEWIDNFPSHNILCALVGPEYTGDPAQNLIIYNSEDFSTMDTIDLPFFYHEGDKYEPDAKYVFTDSREKRLFVLQQAEENYPGEQPWMLCNFSLE